MSKSAQSQEDSGDLWRLALRFAQRDLRSGLAGFRIFLIALTLGVAAIAGVGSLGDAFLTGLAEHGRAFLGGDVRIQRFYQPATSAERAFLSRYGRVSEISTTRSMATSPAVPDQRTLIELKAVDAGYPLVGAPVLSPAIPLSHAIACDAHDCGAAVEDALLTRLGLKLGDPVRVGNSNFAIRAVLVSEPDRVAGGFVLGPRVMVSQEGLQRSGLVTPGSLIIWSYRVAFTGKATIEDFRKDLLKAWPQSAWEISDRNNAIPNVTQFIDQATMFLGLVGLTALVVAGIGAGQAVEAFLKGKRTSIAILKSLGAETGLIFRIYLVEIAAVSALGLFAGGIAGALFPYAVEHFFGDRIPVPAHYALYAGPLLLATAFGLLSVAGFALPPLARACAIAPAGLFRDLVAPSRIRARWRFHVAAGAAFAGIALLSMLVSPRPLFNLAFLGGAAVVLVALRLVAAGLITGLGRVKTWKSQTVRLAISSLTRPGTPVAGTMVALGLGLTLLAAVVLTQESMEAEVQDQLPAHAPSFFFIDIQPNQIAPFTKLVSGFPESSDFNSTPMLRGRIVKLNGVPVADAHIAADSRWAVNSDRAVTYASVPPKEAKVVEGPPWWPANYVGPTLVSFDRNLARGMGLKIGDTITVNIIGRDIDMRIFNLRDINFRSGGMNFVFMASPGVVDRAPHTFLATARTAPNREEAMFSAVSRAFPNVTIVRVRDSLAQLGEMLQALANGIEIASLVTILAGALVLAGAIANGHRARLYDAVVLKVLGATRGKLAAVYATEYGLLGALSGLAALLIGSIAAWAVDYFVLDVPFVFVPGAVALTIVGGAVGTIVLGLTGGFLALSEKPAARLRNL
jgi:putative ABC transport system permease protein